MFDYWRVYPFMFHEYFIIALLYHQYEPLLLFPMITIPLYPMNIPLYSYSFPICLQENPAGPGNPWYPTPSPWNIPFNPDKTAFLLVNQLITSINIMSHRFPHSFSGNLYKNPTSLGGWQLPKPRKAPPLQAVSRIAITKGPSGPGPQGSPERWAVLLLHIRRTEVAISIFNIYIYVYICIYVYVYMCICLYVYMYKCIYV